MTWAASEARDAMPGCARQGAALDGNSLLGLTSEVRFYDPGEAETVVFDPPSGNTHLLTAIGVRILNHLRTAPGTAPGTAAGTAPGTAPAPTTFDDLRRSFQTSNPDFARPEVLGPVVAELEELGLVEIIR